MARKMEANPVIDLLRSWRPYLLPSLGVTFAVLAVLVLINRWERFLREDPRFALRAAELGERVSPDVRIQGVKRTPMSQVRAVFLEDEGRSLYMVPLDRRRDQLRDLRWIKEASVSRFWPNRVDVRVEERVPVAFVQVTMERRSATGPVQLMDSDGILLPVQDRQDYPLPLLTGIKERHSRGERSARVRLMQRLLADLGSIGKRVSEIDVSEPDNLKVVYPTEKRALTLILGGEEWKARMEKFLRHYPEIQKRMPGAIKLDLRLPDRITATEVDESDHGE